jgi:hypothetical protein
MGNGTIDISNSIKPEADDAQICGAMAEQRRGDGRHENDSTPQQFLHLIGCRDPNARSVSWVCRRPPVPKA